jgi:hypothetical protein
MKPQCAPLSNIQKADSHLNDDIGKFALGPISFLFGLHTVDQALSLATRRSEFA